MSDPALLIESLSKAFGNHRVLEDLSVKVGPGEVVALRGPNGAGKSTLLGCCCGNVIADSGRVVIGGHELSAAPLKARAALRYISQESELPPGLTGDELLSFWVEVFKATPAQLSEAKDLLQLGDSLSRLTTTYSVGMRRRLHMAQLALGKPALFLLDEPFAGVDGESRRRLAAWLGARVTQGVGMLLAAHDADEPELEGLGARELWVGPKPA